jgi:L-ascorbate metabolism protein UlaG (beta-lactamase superfamily)
MQLIWLGHSCFKIQEKIGSETVTIITDPFGKETGLKVPRMEADILTISHDHYDHNNKEAVKGSPYVITTAGEYDIKGIAVEGVDSYHDEKQGKERGRNIIYRFDIDSLSVVHLGDLGQDLDDKQFEKIGAPDILLIPVGGTYTIGAKKAAEIAGRLEPRMVIPMHYKIKDLKINIEGVEGFVKELGIKPRYEEKLKINKKDLQQGEMELVVMSI